MDKEKARAEQVWCVHWMRDTRFPEQPWVRTDSKNCEVVRKATRFCDRCGAKKPGGGEMSDFGSYMLAQSKRGEAYERYNYASVALQNAQIKERLAEIKSQAQPLDELLTKPLSERDRLYAAAFYVVVGRMPGGEDD